MVLIFISLYVQVCSRNAGQIDRDVPFLRRITPTELCRRACEFETYISGYVPIVNSFTDLMFNRSENLRLDFRLSCLLLWGIQLVLMSLLYRQPISLLCFAIYVWGHFHHGEKILSV